MTISQRRAALLAGIAVVIAGALALLIGDGMGYDLIEGVALGMGFD